MEMCRNDKHSLFLEDTSFGKKFKLVQREISLKGYGGLGKVHPDLIPFPDNPGRVLMVYTPENPGIFENMCLVHSNDCVNWTDDLWENPLIYRDERVEWKDYHLADFCLLYVPELEPKWWTWFQPEGSEYGCQIALGLSNDGIYWSDNIEGNPIMRAREDGNEWEYDYVRAPSVLWNRYTQKFEMFYDNLTPDWSEPIRLCRAESSDGRTWVNRAIIYDPKEHDDYRHAFHPVVRYFDGYYWCWFPRYNEGLWFMYSPTGLPGDWSEPYPILDAKVVGAKSFYRVGVFFDPNNTVHMMASAIHEGDIFKIHYLISHLSVPGREHLKELQYGVRDYAFGGSVIGRCE